VRVAYLGNFAAAPWTTENHVALSLESLGHEVVRIQEGDTRAVDVPDRAESCTLFLWTQTYGLAVTGGTIGERFAMLERLRTLGLPTVGFHLDRWWGLDREDQLREEPFFRVDYLFTADGGHDAEWEAAGVNHHWSPPAVYHGEATNGKLRAMFMCDVAFVGSWRHYGHAEHWPYRRELVERLRGWYGRRFHCWPRNKAIRGEMLNDLYASAKIVVGDSCITGSSRAYVSDRVPETTGRGGFLLHPHVDGVFPDLWEDGVHLRTWPMGDWDALHELIEHYLAYSDERERIRTAGARHTRENHTYRHRLEYVLSVVVGNREVVA
jgi:hypothetical protein